MNNFDWEYYINHYPDLKAAGINTREGALYHWFKYGLSEGRQCNKNNIKVLFDWKFYIRTYTDLQATIKTQNDAFTHWLKHGIKENRICCDSNNKAVDFNWELYIKLYPDLQKAGINTKEKAYNHWIQFGIYENRITSINIDMNEFNNNYPDFNLNYYKKFNENINFKTDVEYYIHFSVTGSLYNKQYFEYNFSINDYQSPPNSSHIYYNKIVDHLLFRKIKTYEELNNHYKKNIRPYFIYNMESFNKYYSGFDLNYYKNKYFNKSNKSDLDIILYYHTQGKYKKHTINDKIKIIIYTPVFYINCGGVVVLHNIANIINKSNKNIIAKLFNIDNLKYDNIFCNDFANIDEIDENTIVIYPEIVSGNPLNAPKVIRWILLDLGIEMPINHYTNWGKNDLVYFWESKQNPNKYFKQLSCSWFNPIFKNNHFGRNNTCFLIKKGKLIHNNINFYHNNSSINIEGKSLSEVNDIFNKSKYFYCYDPNSMFVLYAALCGCIPIIYPINEMDKKTYMENRIYKCGDNIIDIGLAYGNSKDEIENAEDTIKNINININKIINYYKKNVDTFLDDIINNKLENTIKNYFY